MDDSIQRKALSTHGAGFHYAVIAAIVKACRERGIPWRFIASEVPVSLNGHDTHADFVFQHQQGHFLIGECKRVDPSYAEWLFARSRYTSGGSPAPGLIDALQRVDPSGKLHLVPVQVASSASTYQVGVAVKKADKGESAGSDKNAIASAVTQVSRAAGGFAEICRDNSPLVTTDFRNRAQILPAVFTTATLTKCEQELEVSDLATGRLPASATFSTVPWLWYQHGVSGSLRASLPGRYVAEDMPTWAEYFRRVAIRAVAVVNADGIVDFLEASQDF